MLERDLEAIVLGKHARVRRFRSSNALVLIVPKEHPVWSQVEELLDIEDVVELGPDEIECAEMDEDGDLDFSYPEP